MIAQAAAPQNHKNGLLNRHTNTSFDLPERLRIGVHPARLASAIGTILFGEPRAALAVGGKLALGAEIIWAEGAANRPSAPLTAPLRFTPSHR